MTGGANLNNPFKENTMPKRTIIPVAQQRLDSAVVNLTKAKQRLSQAKDNLKDARVRQKDKDAVAARKAKNAAAAAKAKHGAANAKAKAKGKAKPKNSGKCAA